MAEPIPGTAKENIGTVPVPSSAIPGPSLPPETTVPAHTHDGQDAPPIDPRMLFIPITATVPTDSAPEGTLRLYSTGGTYRLYARVSGGWHYAALT